jgi:hypothetical protein
MLTQEGQTCCPNFEEAQMKIMNVCVDFPPQSGPCQLPLYMEHLLIGIDLHAHSFCPWIMSRLDPHDAAVLKAGQQGYVRSAMQV